MAGQRSARRRRRRRAPRTPYPGPVLGRGKQGATPLRKLGASPLGRRAAAPVAPPAPARPEKAGGKNRPTPSRASAQAANRRPLVASDRRAAGRGSRESARAERVRAREGMLAGDERYLPSRDRGPVRRYVRDVVDARRNAGEHFLLVVIAILVTQLVVRSVTFQLVTTAVLWAAVLVVVVDGFLLARALRRGITERFGAAALERGVVRYGVFRALQLRRSRIPRPAVQRGQRPR
nr:DUF3043 domain-containing protein [Quadrisphaera sp. DSM 44207]